ncbi:MAG: excinuclease ABC subunit UvrC [Treponema sp.]|nr:excinuclease ABC subunit UvrC [Treponema sp.]
MNTQINTAYEKLHQTALKAPSSSGVYMWRNHEGTVIYVGKAKNLKNRLSSYFSAGQHIKTRLLVSNAENIEYITTSNEYEAFLLENNLIKKYNPHYNIQLKDGKSYPSLKITNEDFPRFYKTRLIKKDGSLYFGPYPDAGALDTFIDSLYKLYPVRHCRTFKKRTAPCMYYHIGRCKAPCCNKISSEAYNEFIEEIKALLEGKGDETVNKLQTKMKEAASQLNFEKAARIRDSLKALAILQNQNIVEDFESGDRDYIAHWREGELVSFTVLKIRGGKLLGRDNFQAESLDDDGELVEEFAREYYTDNSNLPPEIYISGRHETSFLKFWINKNLNSKSRIIQISQNVKDADRKHRAALDMAQENAKEDIIRRLRERGDIPAMEELRELLDLPRLPVRIEGFDIAHIGGKFPVASLISFYNGNPDKKNYRYFRLRTTNGVIDDFASMREAASRRYSRLINEGKPLPDLLLIDGGIGQVNAVDGILKALGADIPIAGLAKRDEEIWRPHTSRPICLPKRSDGLRLLQRVRDETHRFATSRNQNLRTKENVVSIFASLPHVGPKRELLLIKEFTTLENLADSDADTVAALLRIKTPEAGELLEKAKELAAERKKSKETKQLILNSRLKKAASSPDNGSAESASYSKRLAMEALDLPAVAEE